MIKINKPTVSVSDLTEILGISRTMAYQLVNSKGFPRVKIGSRIVIPVEALRKWVSDNVVM